MKKIIFLFLILISIGFSAQSQITWTMGMNIASSASGNEHPRMVTNASGNPLLVWHHANRAMFSRWNGSTFTTPVMLNPASMLVAGASWMGPDIASHGDTIYVVMKQSPEADTASHIYIVHSFDGGQNFSMPVRVDFIADSISRFPTVTTDAFGNPIVAFMKFNSTFGDARWVVTKSYDYGNTFTADVKASGWSSTTSTVCDCCPGSIVCNANKIAMLYRDNNSNIRDSWAGISTDTGATFSNGINLDLNNWMLNACPSTGPDGVIIGDTLYSVFMNGASGMSRVYYNANSLNSSAIYPSQNVVAAVTGLSQQNYPRIANSGNAVAIVWRQSVNGTEELSLLFTNNINYGFPATNETVDLDYITNTDVALTDSNIFVVWQDDNSGTIKFRKGSFIPNTSGINEFKNTSLISVYPNPVTNGFVTLQFNTIHNSKIKFTIENCFGQKIISNDATVENNKLQIDISSLARGTYFVKVNADNHTTVSKIVKF